MSGQPSPRIEYTTVIHDYKQAEIIYACETSVATEVTSVKQWVFFSLISLALLVRGQSPAWSTDDQIRRLAVANQSAIEAFHARSFSYEKRWGTHPMAGILRDPPEALTGRHAQRGPLIYHQIPSFCAEGVCWVLEFTDADHTYRLTGFAPDTLEPREAPQWGQEELSNSIALFDQRGTAVLAFPRALPSKFDRLFAELNQKIGFLHVGGISPFKRFSELLEEWDAELLSAPDDGDSGTIWHVRLRVPEAFGRGCFVSGSHFDLYLDGSRAFHVTTLRAHEVYAMPDGESLRYEYVNEVTAFYELGDGRFFPREVEFREIKNGEEQPVSRRLFVRDLAWDDAVPPELLDFRIPENVVVQKPIFEVPSPMFCTDPVVGYRYIVWGPDNLPLREMSESEWVDFKEAEFARLNPRSSDRRMTSPFGRLRLALAAGGLLALLFGLIHWRRLRFVARGLG